MKHLCLILVAALISACSSLQPYKEQSLDYLKNIEQNPVEYRGKVVAFSGEVKGVTEDTRHLRLVLKTDVPFYYYATGKGNALSYELLLVQYIKPTPEMSGIQKGNDVKILARVGTYEKRQNRLGTQIGVLRLHAFALTNRTQKKDFFQPSSPEQQLYESWKKGKLFYEETAEQITSLYPAAPPEPAQPTRSASPAQPAPAAPPKAIMYDEVEDFVLTP